MVNSMKRIFKEIGNAIIDAIDAFDRYLETYNKKD